MQYNFRNKRNNFNVVSFDWNHRAILQRNLMIN